MTPSRARAAANYWMELIAGKHAASTIEAVLEATDNAIEAGRCAFGFGACDPDHPCSLHPIWNDLNRSVGLWANRTTFADLGPPPSAATVRRRRGRG